MRWVLPALSLRGTRSVSTLQIEKNKGLDESSSSSSRSSTSFLLWCVFAFFELVWKLLLPLSSSSLLLLLLQMPLRQQQETETRASRRTASRGSGSHTSRTTCRVAAAARDDEWRAVRLPQQEESAIYFTQRRAKSPGDSGAARVATQRSS